MTLHLARAAAFTLALLASAGFVQAQTPTGDDAASTEASGADAAEPQSGQAYLAEEHGDWEIRCVTVEEGVEPCQLYQLLTDTQGASVAEISIVALPEGEDAAAGVTLMTPLETLLTEQVTLSIDGNNPRRYPFRFCTQAGCLVRFGLTDADVDAMRRGATAPIRLVPALAPDEEVQLSVSLSGFTAGFAALEARATP